MQSTSMPRGLEPPSIDSARIRALVNDFYSDIRADTELGPIFGAVIGEQWDFHLDRMVDFWSTVMLGTHSFRGNVYGRHMVIEGIRREHFQRWLALWSSHTNRLFDKPVADEFQRVAHNVARSLHYGLFNEFPAPAAAAPR